MDINGTNFWNKLPMVMRAIAESAFVVFDLEMSGVKVKRPAQASKMRPSLQEIYEEAKEAAEAFQILEFGLTCVAYDEEEGSYISKSFNFALTQLCADTKMAKALDRKLCFSYKSLLFLQEHGFRMDDGLKTGVVYLSCQELAELHQQFLVPDWEKSRPVIDIASCDTRAQYFYEEARAQIHTWWTEYGNPDYVNITNPFDEKISNQQVCLVHQLVQTEFNQCLCASSKGHFIQVTRRHLPTEEKQWQSRQAERQKAVREQTGFLHVIAALAKGVSAIELSKTGCYLDPETNRQLEEEEKKLRSRRPILVGHNQFVDLCFIYNTFIGTLPDTVEGFQLAIHALFPHIVDTKYMLTPEIDDMMADYTLQQSFNKIQAQSLPPMAVSEDRGGLGYTTGVAHTAGFDSWMTAMLFIKASANLARLQTRNLQAVEEGVDDMSEDQQATQSQPKQSGQRASDDHMPAFQASGLRIARPSSLLDDHDDELSYQNLDEPLEPVRVAGSSRQMVVEWPLVQEVAKVQAKAERHKVPEWDSEFFRRIGNRIRVGNSNILQLGPWAFSEGK